MPSSEDADAVVLAGGGSRRFESGEKALATVGGRSLLARVVGVAGEVTGGTPIVAVATPEQRERFGDALDAPVRFVTDAPGEAGPLAGLESAIAASDADWLLVLGCDMPLVERAGVEWLATKRSERADAIVPRTDDGIHPLHAWYRRDALAAGLRSDRADRSLHALLEELSTNVVPAGDAPANVRLDRSLCNVNTRDDLAAARRLLEA